MKTLIHKTDRTDITRTFTDDKVAEGLMKRDKNWKEVGGSEIQSIEKPKPVKEKPKKELPVD